MVRDVAPLPEQTDVLVIGGGIIGAGIALMAARRNAKVVLVEARDFAWGTSSRSSKLIHGGLRYLATGQLALIRESVRERAVLLADAPGLVAPQRFLMPHRRGDKTGRRKMGIGLWAYDRLAGTRTRRFHDAAELAVHEPEVRHDELIGGWSHWEAQTDDARLVLRVLHEAVAHGAVVRNYCAVRSLLRDAGRVTGVRVADEQGAVQDLLARCVVNATGVWADVLRGELGAAPLLRPLRGSHLLLPLWRLPIAHAVALMHPRDARPVFAYPWEGMALVGTTDLDHLPPLSQEPTITEAEVTYLLEALHHAFASLDLRAADVVSTFAGVRPVVAGGSSEPSSESRDHIVLDEQGLLTVTGGKLTTFRAIAIDALRHAATRVPSLRAANTAPLFAPVVSVIEGFGLAPVQQRRLSGRHGSQAHAMLAGARAGELDAVAGSDVLWAELRWAARHEWVQHLDDLLLRRTRLGLLRPQGAQEVLLQLAPMVQAELGWNDARWSNEVQRYRQIIDRCYSLPAGLRDGVPRRAGDAP